MRSLRGPRTARSVAPSAVMGLVLAALSGCAWSGWRPPSVVARDYAKKWEPVPLAGLEGETPSQLTLRARVWVAPGRNSLLNWRSRFVGVLDDANRVLRSAAALEIEVVGYADMPERLPPNARTFDLLDHLAALDDGRGVDLVIGLASPLSIYTNSMDNLGAARVHGKHIVLRGFGSLVEQEKFRSAFDDLPQDELEALLRRRQRHRQTAVLLHEVAHALGAGHVPEPERLMSPAYSRETFIFGPDALAHLRARSGVIDPELGLAKIRAAAAASDPEDPTSTRPRESSRPRGPPLGPPASGLPRVRSAPGPSRTNLDPAEAEARLSAILAETTGPAKAEHDPRLDAGLDVVRWVGPNRRLDFAGRLIDRRRLEDAEAVVSAGSGEAFCRLRAKIASLRHRLPAHDIPRAERTELRRRLEALVSPSRAARRRRRDALAELEKIYPGTSAVRVGRCFVAVEGQLRARRSTCEAAVSADPNAALAHLLLGVVLTSKDRGHAVESLGRAVVLDPGLELGWRKLRALLSGARGKDIYRQLEAGAEPKCP